MTPSSPPPPPSPGVDPDPVEVAGELLGDVGLAPGRQPHHHDHLAHRAHAGPA